MKKVLIIFLLLYGITAKADLSLTEYQKRKVRQVVSEYCDNISNYIRSRDAATASSTERIFRLVNNNSVRIYDDISMETEDVNYYLLGLNQYRGSLSFSFKENINTVEIVGLSRVNISKSTEKLNYGQIELTKIIKGSINRTVKNVFLINLDNYKIMTITNRGSITPEDLWIKGLNAYKNRKFKDAFANFKKCADMSEHNQYTAMGQYSVGVLSIRGRGCRRNFHQGISYLKKSARQGNSKAYELLLHFDVTDY